MPGKKVTAVFRKFNLQMCALVYHSVQLYSVVILCKFRQGAWLALNWVVLYNGLVFCINIGCKFKLQNTFARYSYVPVRD
jgi:hypothetical protein